LEKQLGVINQKFNYIISSYKSFNLKLEKCNLKNVALKGPAKL